MTERLADFPRALAADPISLCEALDRVLNKGAVVFGEITLSVADVDLIYLGLQVVLTSIDKVRETPAFGATLAVPAAIAREADRGSS